MNREAARDPRPWRDRPPKRSMLAPNYSEGDRFPKPQVSRAMRNKTGSCLPLLRHNTNPSIRAS